MTFTTSGIKGQSAVEAKIGISTRRTFWIATGFTFAISLTSLIGWMLGIKWLESVVPGWTPMRQSAAFCFIISAAGLTSLFAGRSYTFKKILPSVSAILLIVINILIIATWLKVKLTGREFIDSDTAFTSIFLSPVSLLPLEGSVIFLLVGVIIMLMIPGKRKLSGIAHTICLGISVLAYLIPAGYILGILSFQGLFGSNLSQVSGIAFCTLSVAIFTSRKDTWFMKVFTSGGSGGIMARKLILWMIILPLVIAWLRINGERSGVFNSETGTLLVAVTYTVCFILLIWMTAKSVNRIDTIRQKAVEELKKAYDTLEEKVSERTAELLSLNQKLDNEIAVRIQAEKLVTLERERMNNLLELMPAYVILLNPDYRVAYSNRYWQDRFGFSEGKRCYEFLFNRLEPCEVCETFKVFKDNKIHTWEWTGPDGHIFSIYDYPYTDSDGSPLIMEMGFDITDLKKAESDLQLLNLELERKVMERTGELQVANERLHILSETAANLLASENPQELVNSLCKRIMEYLDCQVFFNYLSQGSTGILHLNSYAGIPEKTAGKIEFLEYGIAVCGCVAKEGKRIVAENIPDNADPRTDLVKSFGVKAYACHPLFSHDEVIGTLSFGTCNRTKFSDDDLSLMKTVTDQVAVAITRVRDREIIRKSKEKLDIALETGQIGIWEWNVRTNTFFIDERMGKMLGIEKRVFTGTYEAFEKSIHEEDLAHVRNAIKLALIDGKPVETIFRVRRDNEEVNYITTKALVEKENGSALRVSGVCFDITGMKKGAEKALFLLNEELLRSNRELEQFAYVASHDLQEPLRMVSSFTQLLSRRYSDKLDRDAHEFIQYAVDGAARMQVLINDLLDYSRISTRSKKYTDTDMHNILGQAVKNLSLNIREKHALVTNDELPVVFADEGQMVQLVQNLISNSLKFSKNEPRIHISVMEGKDDYIFSVKDNGIGIESQYFVKIFQIFQRLHPKEEYGGTGIGLAICKRIVESHGGRIWIESKPGKGTVFYFTIRKR